MKVILASNDGAGDGGDNSSYTSVFLLCQCTYERYEVVQKMRLPRRHAGKPFMLDMHHMDMEVVCHMSPFCLLHCRVTNSKTAGSAQTAEVWTLARQIWYRQSGIPPVVCCTAEGGDQG